MKSALVNVQVCMPGWKAVLRNVTFPSAVHSSEQARSIAKDTQQNKMHEDGLSALAVSAPSVINPA